MTLVARNVLRLVGGRSPCPFPTRQVVLPFSAQTFATSQKDSPKPTSANSQFKQTPVNPSILKYIESIGVGKPKRSSRRKKSKENFFSFQEEKEQFQRVRRAVSAAPPPPFVYSSSNLNHKSDSGKRIKRFPVKVLGSVESSDEKFPKATPGLPEVAIAGRSNVGKSTLLNALLYGSQDSSHEEAGEGRTNPKRKRTRPTSRTARLPKGLKAATSSKPGETRKVSFYQLSAKVDEAKVSLLLVDLPGYGFAYASEERAEQWQSLMQSYIVGRGKSLKRILLLIDSRHGMKKADVDFLESMQNTLHEKDDGTSPKKRELPPIQIVLTKCDLVSQVDLARRVVAVRQQLSDSLRRQPSALPIMLVSAQMEGQGGVVEIQKELASLVPTHVRGKSDIAQPQDAKP